MSLRVDIEKRLGNFHLRVRFECADGITGFLGASGCGKSFTLKCIAGIEKPDRGFIALDDDVLFDSERHIDLKPQQRRVGYMFQNYALFPNMNVRQNILCGLHREKDRAQRERRLREALELFQLKELDRHRPAQLSGGQQQRVALARIWVNQPRLLMLDEPFSALDAHLRLQLQLEMLTILKQSGIPTLMVTHSRDEAYRMCDSIAVMNDGLLYAPVPTRQLFNDPGSVAAAILTGCNNIVPARKVGEKRLMVPEWGVTLDSAQPVPDNVTHVGIRAHYFAPDISQNRFPVVFAGDVEEPFEWVVAFRYAAQLPGSKAIWWRVSKENRPPCFPEKLGIAPVYVLPLVDTGENML